MYSMLFGVAGEGDALVSESAGLGLMCLGLFLLIPLGVLGIYVFVRLSVMIPALMVEGLGPVQSLKRSWALIYNNWWRTAGLLLLLSLLNYIISAGPAYFIMGIVGLFVRGIDPVMLSAITSGVSVLTGMLFIPLQLAAITLYYFDLRVRKEGFDIEAAMTQRFGPGQPEQTAVAGGYGSYAGYGGNQPHLSSSTPFAAYQERASAYPHAGLSQGLLYNPYLQDAQDAGGAPTTPVQPSQGSAGFGPEPHLQQAAEAGRPVPTESEEPKASAPVPRPDGEAT
jgi:hypothetical protein